MKNVTARQLFRPQALINSRWGGSIGRAIVCLLLKWRRLLSPRPHVFSTNDADILTYNFFCSSIWIFGIHVPCSLPIPDEIGDTFIKRSNGESNIADDVYRHAVEHAEHTKERDVQNQFEEVLCPDISEMPGLGKPMASYL